MQCSIFNRLKGPIIFSVEDIHTAVAECRGRSDAERRRGVRLATNRPARGCGAEKVHGGPSLLESRAATASRERENGARHVAAVLATLQGNFVTIIFCAVAGTCLYIHTIEIKRRCVGVGLQVELRRGADEGRGPARVDVSESAVATGGAAPSAGRHFPSLANHRLCSGVEFQQPVSRPLFLPH